MGACRVADLRCKEVINISDGARLGFVYDVEVDVVCGQLVSIIVPGKVRFFWWFRRAEEYRILWGQIVKIGEDIILVDCRLAECLCPRPPRAFFRFDRV